MSSGNELGTVANTIIDRMFRVGAHFGYSRSRRHPSVAPFIFGAKNRTEIFNLEKTQVLLDEAKAFAKGVAASGKKLLYVGGKNEAQDVVRAAALSVGMPYVASRWIGGSITNYGEIRRRLERLEKLTVQREKGELAKYTKKERLLIDRDIARLEDNFKGILPMKELPGALLVVDTKREAVAVAEALKSGIPIIGISNSDCDINNIDYPIVANDATQASVKFFVDEVTAAFKEGLAARPPEREAGL